MGAPQKYRVTFLRGPLTLAFFLEDDLEWQKSGEEDGYYARLMESSGYRRSQKNGTKKLKNGFIAFFAFIQQRRLRTMDFPFF